MEIFRLQFVFVVERDQYRSVYLEFEIVKKNVSILQVILSDVWSYYDICSLELVRVKEEIIWFEVDLQVV